MKSGFLIIFLLFFGANVISAFAGKVPVDDILKVRSIRVVGNKRTKTPIIVREVVFKEGDFVSSAKLEEDLELTRANITNLNLFLEIELLPVIDSLKHLDLTIILKERWFWSVLPHLTLADRSFNEWWYERGRDIKRLTYGIDVRHANFTGNADQFTAKFYFGFVPTIELYYNKPYIDKKRRIGLSGSLFFNTQKTVGFRTWDDKIDFLNTEDQNFKRFGGILQMRYRRTHNYFHSIYFGFTRSIISDTLVNANYEYFGDGSTEQSMISLGYEFRMDFRDVRQYPLKGNLFIGSLSQNVGIGGKSQTNILLRYNHFFPISKRWYFDTDFRTKASFPKEQSYYLVSGIGYGGNIARGYELYVVDGQYFILNRNTLKFMALNHKFNLDWLIKTSQFSTLPIKIFPNVFFDYAFVRNFYPERSNSELSNEPILGGGGGVDFITFYNINIRTYYTFNKMSERKFFFSISRDF